MVDLDGYDKSLGGADVASNVVDALAGIPPVDSFWNDVELFVERVRTLAAEKLAVRERMQHEQQLQRMLEQLRTAGAEALAFHEASDALKWSAADFDPLARPVVTAACAELYDRLTKYTQLHHLPPSNRTAARERRAQLESLEEEIVERLSRVRGLLSPPTHPDSMTNAGDTHSGSVVQTPPDAVDAPREEITTPADELHPTLDPQGEQFSVFTVAEERRLSAPRPGVRLVFASRATGLDSVDVSMKRIAQGRTALLEVPRTVEPADVVPWVNEHASTAHRTSLIAWQRLGRWSTELGSGIRHLLDANADAWSFPIVLVGGPTEARSFLFLDAPQQGAGAKVDAVVSCGRWTLAAIDARIRQTRLDAGPSGASEVMSATGGWQRLVEVLWAGKPTESRLEPKIAAFNATFRSPGGYSGFRAALGLAAFPEAETAFLLLARPTYSPLPDASVPRWIAERNPGLPEAVAARAIAFLKLFQLVELDDRGNLVLDTVAREVLNADF